MTSGPHHRQFAYPEERRETFKNYPKKFPDITRLVEAGFFYIGTGDEDDCECYLCGVRLFQWNIDDDPMEEHRKHKPSCEVFNPKIPEKSVHPPRVRDPFPKSSALNPDNFLTPQPGTPILPTPGNYRSENIENTESVAADCGSTIKIFNDHLTPKPMNMPPPHSGPNPVRNPSNSPHSIQCDTMGPTRAPPHVQSSPQIYPPYSQRFYQYPPHPPNSVIPQNFPGSPPVMQPYYPPNTNDTRFSYTRRV